MEPKISEAIEKFLIAEGYRITEDVRDAIDKLSDAIEDAGDEPAGVDEPASDEPSADDDEVLGEDDDE